MNQPLVSIIIPCFNGERFVGEAIRSALDQTYPSVDVIVIDDGSTDESLEVIRSFSDHVRWVTGPKRGGSAARNRGLELARGEFIQFLDADDVLHREKLEKQVVAVVESGADLVFCQGQLGDGTDPEDKKYKREYHGGDPVLFVLGGVLQTGAPLHRKGKLEAVCGFREDLGGAQEFDLHLRLASAGLTFHCLPEVLYTVHRVPGSVSSNFVRTAAEQFKIIPPIVQQLQQAGSLTADRRKALAERMAQNGRGCLQRGGYDEARRFFHEAKLLHSSSGFEGVYDRPARVLARVIGPMWTERLVGLKRRCFNRYRLQNAETTGEQG